MEEDVKENPDKIFEVQSALLDGNLVAVASWIRQKPEHFGQAYLPDMDNENGMF